MLIQCPVCKHDNQLSEEQLTACSGTVRCENCTALFDTPESTTTSLAKENEVFDEVFPLLKPSASHQTRFWSYGYLLCMIMLLLQLYYFEADNISQSKLFRPWLAKTCKILQCSLPVYKNLDEFSILYGSFEEVDDHLFVFKASFVNQSRFEQHYPAIKLTLLNYSGQNIAERVFHAKDYLHTSSNLIKPGMVVEISLQIVKPSVAIGGYRFELT